MTLASGCGDGVGRVPTGPMTCAPSCSSAEAHVEEEPVVVDDQDPLPGSCRCAHRDRMRKIDPGSASSSHSVPPWASMTRFWRSPVRARRPPCSALRPRTSGLKIAACSSRGTPEPRSCADRRLAIRQRDGDPQSFPPCRSEFLTRFSIAMRSSMGSTRTTTSAGTSTATLRPPASSDRARIVSATSSARSVRRYRIDAMPTDHRSRSSTVAESRSRSPCARSRSRRSRSLRRS